MCLPAWAETSLLFPRFICLQLIYSSQSPKYSLADDKLINCISKTQLSTFEAAILQSMLPFLLRWCTRMCVSHLRLVEPAALCLQTNRIWEKFKCSRKPSELCWVLPHSLLSLHGEDFWSEDAALHSFEIAFFAFSCSGETVSYLPQRTWHSAPCFSNYILNNPHAMYFIPLLPYRYTWAVFSTSQVSHENPNFVTWEANTWKLQLK